MENIKGKLHREGSLKGSADPSYSTFYIISVSCFSLFSSLIYSYLNTMLPSEAKKYDSEDLANILGWAYTGSALCDALSMIVCTASDKTNPESKFGRRLPFIITGSLASIFGCVQFLTAFSLRSLIIGFIVSMAGASVSSTISNALITEIMPSTQSSRTSTAMSLFSLLGSTLGLIGVAMNGIPPFIAILTLSIIMIVMIVLQYRAIISAHERFESQQAFRRCASNDINPPRPIPTTNDSNSTNSFYSFENLFGFKLSNHIDFCYCLIARAFANAGLASLGFIQLYLTDCVGVQDSEVLRTTGLLLLFTQGASLVFTLPAGKLADAKGKRVPMALGLCLVSIALPILSFIKTQTAALSTSLLFGIGTGLYYSLEMGAIYESLPSRKNGAKHLGQSLIACTIGSLAGQQICGQILQSYKIGNSYDRKGYSIMFIISSLLNSISMVFCWMTNAKRARLARKALDIDRGISLALSPPPSSLSSSGGLLREIENSSCNNLFEHQNQSEKIAPNSVTATVSPSISPSLTPYPSLSTNQLSMSMKTPQQQLKLKVKLPKSVSVPTIERPEPMTPPSSPIPTHRLSRGSLLLSRH